MVGSSTGTSTITFGTSTVNGGVSVPAGQSPEPKSAPKALVATQAVQVKDGWVGQIVVGEAIVWESKEPWAYSRAAEEEATERVLKKFARLFA